MINKVLKTISKNRILEIGDSVVLGVSGGADSICMLYVLNEIKMTLNLTLNVVHVNHHIRSEGATHDQEFVKKICEKMDVAFYLVDVDVPQMVKNTGMSEEEAGRTARYQAFYETAKKTGSKKIAVAHNLNDSSETILFNLFRGTGIRGITGIPAKRDMIIRPLIDCTRDDIEKYLEKNGVDYCTDATNLETEYSRNKIRLELLPYIKTNINEKAEYNIVNAGKNLEEIEDFLNIEVGKAWDRYVVDNTLKCEGFGLHSAIINELVRGMIKSAAGRLKDITRSHVLSVIALKDMEVSKMVNLPYNLVAMRTYDGISIKKATDNADFFYEKQILEDGKLLPNEYLNVSIENNAFFDGKIKDLMYTKWFDYDRIHSLTLRNRQEGDFIVVDDKGSHKKLKDYFINEKIPKEERDKILLLADGSHVLWIIGYRISSYYKIDSSSTKALKITYIGQ